MLTKLRLSLLVVFSTKPACNHNPFCLQVTAIWLEHLRFLVNAKKEKQFSFRPYMQVFNDKYGFLPNLSVLDLLFNEGPNSLNYLKEYDLNFLTED